MPDETPVTPPSPAPAPAPAPAPSPAKPDALMIPDRMKRGATKFDRLDSICSYAEPILGGDRAKRITAHVSPQPNGKLFVRLDPLQKINFDSTDVNTGPRYNWVTQPNGVDYGYLVDAAKEAPGA